MTTHDVKSIAIISDGTGRTARRLMDAVLIQYTEKDIEYKLTHTFQNVRSRKAIDRAVAEIDVDSLVLFSIISRDLSDYLAEQLSDRRIMFLNVLQPMIDVATRFLGVAPAYMPGKLQLVNDSYYKKVDAIGFAVSHDDGLGQQLEQADVVLVGISRTCKTPISMYLACNFGLKAANIPVVRDAGLTEILLRRLAPVPHRRIIGLLMQPELLAHIRESRRDIAESAAYLHDQLDDYWDLRTVAREYRFSAELFDTQGWRRVDVTRRAIEEISLEILTLLKE